MPECSCCKEANEPAEPMLLLPCLRHACASCVRDMQELEPKVCVFCHEAACLSGAEPAVADAALVEPLLCIVHREPVRWMCIGCDAVFCKLRQCSELANAASNDLHADLTSRADHLDALARLKVPGCYVMKGYSSPHLFTEFPDGGGTPLWLQDSYVLRKTSLAEFDLHLAEIQAELREHNAEQHAFIERAFRTCHGAAHGGCLGAPACGICPTAAELDLQKHLTLLMRETGAADLKVLDGERADVAHEMEQLDLVGGQIERLIAARAPHPTAQTLAVARRGIALLKQPEKTQTTLTRVSLVCIPPPYDRGARACAAVNRLFLRRRRDMACLQSPGKLLRLPDMDTYGALQHTENVLTFATSILASRDGRPSFYDLDLQTNEGRGRPDLRMVVYARLPDGGIVGHRIVDGSVQNALSCVDLATGADRWCFTLAQAHDGVHLFNDPRQSEYCNATPADDVGYSYTNKAIVSPDGVVLTFWAGTSGIKAGPGYLVALRPDGTVIWCTIAQRDVVFLCLVNREQFGYVCRNPLDHFYVHAIASGAMAFSVVQDTTTAFQREQWTCQARHHAHGCESDASTLFSRSVGVPAKWPLYLWTESTVHTLYLHDGRAVIVEKTSPELGVRYSVRTARKT